jgi:hypothetical protein
MSRDLQNRLDKYCGWPDFVKAKLAKAKYERRKVEVRRVALNYDQVKRYSLIPNPVKQADRRSSAYISQYGDQCWELDAIEPNELITLCRTVVDSLIVDRDAWLAIKKQDKSEREALMKQLEGIAV